MLRQPAGLPAPEKLLEFRAASRALVQDLERKLMQLALIKRPEISVAQIYEVVYLPTAAALAEGLSAFEIADLEMLRQPLSQDLDVAPTQLRIVLEVLHVVVAVLSPN